MSIDRADAGQHGIGSLDNFLHRGGIERVRTDDRQFRVPQRQPHRVAYHGSHFMPVRQSVADDVPPDAARGA